MTIAKKQTEVTDTFIEVNGLKIRENTLYKLENRLDKSAPEAFQKEGTTKIPSILAGTTIQADYDVTRKLYDTGFYIYSPCYDGMEEADKKEKIKLLKKLIVIPFEGLRGEGILEQNNDSFWDTYFINLYDGRVFNTNEIQDTLDLYIAILSNSITPISEEGNPHFNNSEYLIKDTIEVTSKKQERVRVKQKATMHFGILQETNSTALDFILKSLDILPINLTPSESDRGTAFDLWIEKDVQNSDIFEREYEKSKDLQLMENIILKVKLKTLVNRGKIKKEGGQLMYSDVEIGIDVREAVKNLTEKAELADIKEEIRMSK